MITSSAAVSLGLFALVSVDPFAAYKEQAYDRALQGFLDMQVRRPDDPAVQMNVGSAYYRLKNYPEAEKAFSRAAASGDERVRQAAFYDLGNCAYHEGKLEEAVQHYQQALALNGNDVDARHNLDLAQRELRKRREQAQKQQQDKQQQDKQQQDPQQQDKQQQDPQQQDKQQQGKQQQDPQQAPQGSDAAHPTQPAETSPKPENTPQKTQNSPVPSDADKKPHSGREGEQPTEEAKPAEAAPADARAGKPLTKEQAERYLQSVGETRPHHKARGAARRMPNGKDW